MEPFATPDDVKARWLVDLDDAETSRARVTVLLAAASRVARHTFPGIDSRIGFDFDLVRDVVCEMVWGALSSSTPGVTQQTRSVGSVSVSNTFEGATGRLRLSDAQMALLRPPRTGGGRAASISNLPADASERAPGAEGIYVVRRPY